MPPAHPIPHPASPTAPATAGASSLVDASRLRALLPARLADMRVNCVAETGSTNADALQALRMADAAATPMLFQADVQHAGRGRQGRRWIASAGDGLMFSLAWEMPRPVSALGGLSLACGLAVVEALQAHAVSVPAGAARTLRLKWPNDVLADGAKLAGILVETTMAPKGATGLVIGIGINLRRPPGLEAELGRRIATLDELTGLADSTAMLAALVTALDDHLRTFAVAGLQPFIERWKALDAYAGETVRIIDRDEVTLEGTASGIDAEGCLLVRNASGLHAVIGGDVSLRPAIASEATGKGAGNGSTGEVYGKAGEA